MVWNCHKSNLNLYLIWSVLLYAVRLLYIKQAQLSTKWRLHANLKLFDKSVVGNVSPSLLWKFTGFAKIYDINCRAIWLTVGYMGYKNITYFYFYAVTVLFEHLGLFHPKCCSFVFDYLCYKLQKINFIALYLVDIYCLIFS